MATHFLADLHLAHDRSTGAKSFLDYLDGPARRADAVYILGDLFDVWLGDDGSIHRHRTIIDAIGTCVATGVPVHFMRGNRDFGIGDMFVRRTGVRVIDDPTVIRPCGERVLLTHGDSLCVNDAAQQRFRARYTDPDWRARMARLPLWVRRTGAFYGRHPELRPGRKNRADPRIGDADHAAALDYARAHCARRIIHGHTHRPADISVTRTEPPVDRHVLADRRGSIIEVLKLGPDGIHRQTVDSG